MIRPLRVATIDELSVEAFGDAMVVVFSVRGIIFVYNVEQYGNRRRVQTEQARQRNSA